MKHPFSFAMRRRLFMVAGATLILAHPAPTGLGCANYANTPPDPLANFCPLATRMTTQKYGWANPLPDYAADIRNDPRWAGGPVGFALIGNKTNNGGANCPQTKYS